MAMSRVESGKGVIYSPQQLQQGLQIASGSSRLPTGTWSPKVSTVAQVPRPASGWRGEANPTIQPGNAGRIPGVNVIAPSQVAGAASSGKVTLVDQETGMAYSCTTGDCQTALREEILLERLIESGQLPAGNYKVVPHTSPAPQGSVSTVQKSGAQSTTPASASLTTGAVDSFNTLLNKLIPAYWLAIFGLTNRNLSTTETPAPSNQMPSGSVNLEMVLNPLTGQYEVQPLVSGSGAGGTTPPGGGSSSGGGTTPPGGGNGGGGNS